MLADDPALASGIREHLGERRPVLGRVRPAALHERGERFEVRQTIALSRILRLDIGPAITDPPEHPRRIARALSQARSQAAMKIDRAGGNRYHSKRRVDPREPADHSRFTPTRSFNMLQPIETEREKIILPKSTG